MEEVGGSHSHSAIAEDVACASTAADNPKSYSSAVAALRSSEATAAPALAASDRTSSLPVGSGTLDECSTQLSSNRPGQGRCATEDSLPRNAAASRPLEPSGGTVPLHALAVLGHPLPEVRVVFAGYLCKQNVQETE